MKFLSQLFLVGISLLVSACGEDSFGVPDPDKQKMQIRSYQVNNTVATNPPNTVAEQLMSNTDFNLSWLLFSTNPYHVEFWLSFSQAIDTSAVKFYSTDCGSDRTVYPCDNGLLANFSCIYVVNNSNDISLSCEGAKDYLVSNFKDIDAYMIFHACDNLSTNCQTRAVKVNVAL